MASINFSLRFALGWEEFVLIFDGFVSNIYQGYLLIRKSLTSCLANLEQPADGLADDPADGGHLGEGLGRAELALHQN